MQNFVGKTNCIMGTVKVANGMLSVDQGSIHLTKISGNFDPKLNGSVRSNRKSFDIIGPPFEVDHFSRSDRSEFWMNGLDRAHCDVSLPGLLASVAFQGGKTFCASFCASLIAGSRRAFLCVDCVCLLLEFWVKCTRCERLLLVKHFYLTCLLFFHRLKITLDSEQPMLKEKRIIPSVWGGIKGFEHF